MNCIKKVLLFIFLSFFSTNFFAQTSLCNSVYNFLRNNECSPKTQDLISSSINYFPYNITTEFPPANIRQNNHIASKQNLFIIFNQEDYTKLKEICPSVIDFLKNNPFYFSTTLLFTYGEHQKVQKDGMIYGLDTFLNSLNTNEDSTAIIINLQEKESSIISTSSGITTPSWLIKNEYDIFEKADISHGLPAYYLSQMYSYKFNKNQQLDSLFSNEIPAIILNFNSDIDSPQIISNIITESITAFASTQEKIWDQHFLMISFFGHYFRISEVRIVRLIIIIILMSLIFIGLLGFINKSLQRDAWHKIVKIWYSVPITLVLLCLSMFVSKGLFALFTKNFSAPNRLYFYSGCSVFLSFVFTTVYYCFQIIINQKFEIKSLDFITVIIFFLNQFIFSIFDISLLPLFMFVCILAILSLIFKNNFVHIILLLISTLPFVIYIHNLIMISDVNELIVWLYENNWSILFISLALTPLYLMFFRIILVFYKQKETKKTLLVTGGTTIGIVLCIVIIFGCIRPVQLNKLSKNEDKTSVFIQETEALVDIKWIDNKVFDDTVRKLSITFSKPCYQCDVRIITNTGSPIIYSLDDYELLNQNTAYFLIPVNPPQNLTFNYGVKKGQSTIKVTAYFETNDKDKFSLLSKSVTIK